MDELDGFGVEFDAVVDSESAIVDGFILFGVTKIWIQATKLVDNKERKGGMTVQTQHGKESPVALPLSDDVGDPPEGSVSLDQLQFFVTQLFDKFEGAL